MRLRDRLAPIALAASATLAAGAASADPPSFVARPSLREGLRVDACSAPDRCTTWVQFAPRPYRTFVEARMAPSGRFFYVWSKPDGRPREVDVFATPRREAQLAQRRGHWSPGAGGELEWVTRDRLFHRWGCGAACNVTQLYDVYGTTLASFVGQDVELSPDRRYAVIASEREGTLLDLGQVTMRSFHGNEHERFAWDVDWSSQRVSIWFEDEERTDARGAELRRVVNLALDPAPAASPSPAAPASPAPAVAPRTAPRALAVQTPRPAAPATRPVTVTPRAPAVAPRAPRAAAPARASLTPRLATTR